MGGNQGRPHLQDATEEDRKALQAECEALRSKLESLRKRRRQLELVVRSKTSLQLRKLSNRHNAANRERDLALEQYETTYARRREATDWLQLAQEWNVTNDCFHIWHRGPFGTINGLRLGSEIPSLPTTTSVAQEGAVKTDGTNGAYKSVMSYSLGFTEPTSASMSSGSQGDQSIKVPWVEINSALGLLALLLSTLEKKPYSGIEFQNKLVPMGSTSRIGVRKGESFTFYSLYSDDSFQFFGKRNFNIALHGLLSCVADAASAVEKRDRTLALPYAIETTAKGDVTIGGLNVNFGSDGGEWTRAMKHLLTDVKWLVAFSAKHADR